LREIQRRIDLNTESDQPQPVGLLTDDDAPDFGTDGCNLRGTSAKPFW
jgi:hypothetical protein